MVRKTSIETYIKVSNSGLLSKIRLEIYNALYNNGPMTIQETFRTIFPDESDGLKTRSYSPRFAELRNMGLIEECDERQCKVTGNNVIVWQTTDNLGEKLPKRVTKKQKKEEIENLMIELAQTLNEEQKSKLRCIFKKLRDI